MGMRGGFTGLRIVAIIALTLAVSSLAACGGTSQQGTSEQGTSQQSQHNPKKTGQLVFQDDFNGTALDTSKWIPGVEWWVQTACDDSANNVSVSGGAAHLRADDGQSGWCQRSDYSSSIIQTGQHGDPSPFSLKYGYVEARVWITAGQGLWPAVWLVNSGGAEGEEIDLGEWVGADPTRVWETVHFAGGGYLQSSYVGPNWSTGWHTIAVDWRAGSVKWYVDGVVRYTVTDPRVPSHRMYALLDHWIGYPPDNGPPDASTPFPADFRVDYIKAWQRRGGGG
jgi:beta-glucanase (GH16 family)